MYFNDAGSRHGDYGHCCHDGCEVWTRPMLDQPVRIVAQASWTTADGWQTSVGVPMFFLDGTLEEAALAAGRMLCDLAPERTFHIGACDVEGRYYGLDYSKDLGPHNIKR